MTISSQRIRNESFPTSGKIAPSTKGMKIIPGRIRFFSMVLMNTPNIILLEKKIYHHIPLISSEFIHFRFCFSGETVFSGVFPEENGSFTLAILENVAMILPVGVFCIERE